MKKLYRSRNNRVLFGVCGGIAEYFEVDPVIVRLIFVILGLYGGAGLALYLIALILMPDQVENNSKKKKSSANDNNASKSEFEETIESVVEEIKSEFNKNKNDFTGEKILGLILIFLGFILLIRIFIPDINLRFMGAITLILIGLMLLVFASRKETK
jgi:phage shock protein C